MAEDTKTETEQAKEEPQEVFEDISFVESTEDGGEGTFQNKLKKLRDELKNVKKERDEYLVGWQKAKADYINFKNESSEKLKNARSFAQTTFVQDLIPTLDSFSMAMSQKEVWESVDKNWRVGIEYIHQQLQTLLSSYGVEAIETNVAFDPRLHEPMESIQVETEEEADKVHRIIQKGYKVKDMIIRPAKVVVTVLKSTEE